MADDELPERAEVVVIGAGIIGCAVAALLQGEGFEVCVVDRVGPAAGSSSAGEGNLLVSDKLPGLDLELARASLALWRDLADELAGGFEYEPKGGLVVAPDEAALSQLVALAEAQRAEGAVLSVVAGSELAALEPNLSREVAGGIFYEEDAQVQPMLAVDALVRALRGRGGRLVGGVTVRGATRAHDGRIARLSTSAGDIGVGRAVVNAAGAWAGEVATLLGGHVPVTPRRGHVLVTEPVAPFTPHKVYESGYVAAIHEDARGYSTSAVVEATPSGTMLLGSSREFVGFSRTVNSAVRASIAARSIRLFPALASVRLLRTYVGFRPATPDRLPVLGEDVQVPGLLHATGHEGAGVGLAPASARAVLALLGGRDPGFALDPFSPARFAPARQ